MTAFGLDPILLWGEIAAWLCLAAAFVGVAVIVRRIGWGDAWAMTLLLALLGAVFLHNTGSETPSQLVIIGKVACAIYAAVGLLRIAFARWPNGAQVREATSAHL